MFFLFILLHFLALTWIEINDQSKSFANILRTSFSLFCLKPNLYYVHVCFPYYFFSFRRLYKTINTTTEETANVSKMNVPANYISNLLWIIRTSSFGTFWFCRWPNHSALQKCFLFNRIIKFSFHSQQKIFIIWKIVFTKECGKITNKYLTNILFPCYVLSLRHF